MEHPASPLIAFDSSVGSRKHIHFSIDRLSPFCTILYYAERWIDKGAELRQSPDLVDTITDNDSKNLRTIYIYMYLHHVSKPIHKYVYHGKKDQSMPET